MLKFSMLSITYFKKEGQHKILERLALITNEEIYIDFTHSFLLEHPFSN